MSHAPSLLFPSQLSTSSLSTCTSVRLSTIIYQTFIDVFFTWRFLAQIHRMCLSAPRLKSTLLQATSPRTSLKRTPLLIEPVFLPRQSTTSTSSPFHMVNRSPLANVVEALTSAPVFSLHVPMPHLWEVSNQFTNVLHVHLQASTTGTFKLRQELCEPNPAMRLCKPSNSRTRCPKWLVPATQPFAKYHDSGECKNGVRGQLLVHYTRPYCANLVVGRFGIDQRERPLQHANLSKGSPICDWASVGTSPQSHWSMTAANLIDLTYRLRFFVRSDTAYSIVPLLFYFCPLDTILSPVSINVGLLHTKLTTITGTHRFLVQCSWSTGSLSLTVLQRHV